MSDTSINFFCVYTKHRKKLDKYFKNNRIKNKIIIDICQMIEEKEVESHQDFLFLKMMIYTKIKKALEKDKDIYYVPDFNEEFNLSKLMNLKEVIGEESNFNILVFWEDFEEDDKYLNEAMSNLAYFDGSQLLRDY